MPPPPPQPPTPAGNQHDIATELNSLPERVTGLMYPPTGYDQRSIQLAEYKNMGRWDQARPLEQKIFHDQQRLYGNEHLATLTSGYNIAYAELELKSLEEAAKWSNWVSNTSQRVLDIKDPFRMKAESLNGEVTNVKGQYHEAETMLGSIFARQQDSLGDEHLDTLETQQRLADVSLWAGGKRP
jgi:Tetratricopeptide repeat